MVFMLFLEGKPWFYVVFFGEILVPVIIIIISKDLESRSFECFKAMGFCKKSLDSYLLGSIHLRKGGREKD